eukprot:scaffold50915_cov66-Phaeocystis_antarctica.AAC.10
MPTSVNPLRRLTQELGSRGDFVTYGRSRARPSAAARGAGLPAAASASAAGSRAGIYVDINYES